MAQPKLTSYPWYSELLANLTTLSGVGYLAAAYSISRWLTRPTLGPPAQTPSDHGLSWEPISCETADGLRLSGWAVSPPRPRATVALFHGLRRNRMQALSRLAFLEAAGYRCIAFDHRAHGESMGKRSSFGFYESRDVEAVFDLIERRWPNEPRAALGISMGAAALCYAAHRTQRCQAVILEGLYHDIATAFANRINTTYPPAFRRLARGVVWVTERRLGVRLQQLCPARHIGRLAPAPVLLLTGTNDVHATPAETSQLFEHCLEPREMWLVPGAGHLDVAEQGGESYRERILTFLERQLFGHSDLISPFAA